LPLLSKSTQYWKVWQRNTFQVIISNKPCEVMKLWQPCPLVSGVGVTG
jgi:hypothetical protein